MKMTGTGVAASEDSRGCLPWAGGRLLGTPASRTRRRGHVSQVVHTAGVCGDLTGPQGAQGQKSPSAAAAQLQPRAGGGEQGLHLQHEETQKAPPGGGEARQSCPHERLSVSAAAALEKEEEQVVVRGAGLSSAWEWTVATVAPGPALRRGPMLKGVLAGLGTWAGTLRTRQLQLHGSS